ncbi:MAG: hypothetical protein LCI00_18725 [Chloroflexi bacterium]|nr:hypothetical protein [Chloroflexota bacterium]MCC6894548.1 hypothetical protein [Anaerolineae bacterium]
MSLSATATIKSRTNNCFGGLPQSGSTLSLAINANSLVVVYPYFRPIDPKNAMYHRAPIILQIPRFAPAHLPEQNAQFAGGGFTGAFRVTPQEQPSQPPAKIANSAVTRERTARHFGGKYAKRAKNANFANFNPYR